MADDYKDPLEGLFLPAREVDTSMTPIEMGQKAAELAPQGAYWLSENFNPAHIAYDGAQLMGPEESYLSNILGGVTIATAGLPVPSPAGAFRKIVGKGIKDPIKKGFRQRTKYPGIYKPTEQIVEEAAERVAPESPYLDQVLGTNRAEMAEQAISRPGTSTPEEVIPFPEKGRGGSPYIEGIKTPANAKRLIDAYQGFREGAPDLWTGMAGWYNNDKLYGKFIEQFGEDLGPLMFNRWNAATGMHSPASTVLDEFSRGSAAYGSTFPHGKMGSLEDYLKFGGESFWDSNLIPDPSGKMKRDGTPKMIAEPVYDIVDGKKVRRVNPKKNEGAGAVYKNVPGHLAHSTSQAPVFANWMDIGDPMLPGFGFMDSPKVTGYIGASGVPFAPGRVPYQTSAPVADAHMTRMLGVPDVRTSSADVGASANMAEYQGIAPWFKKNVTDPLGIEAVPGQAIGWGGFAPQTGVKTAVGAPKAELFSNMLAYTAKVKGKSYEDMLTDILQGRDHLYKPDREFLNRIGAI